ncbi:hypothetical protein H6G94_24200 [Nostoc punctiforme FACHB-252]|uniref:Uncharacterized protein n=1 Tax=Nostoc punctiforme FACHB-252 TaxID=1357509 RepID=A0ABR8HGV4_NOSPU|nr:hypothetical protein [Nostoc punctiforme]MBD2614338.1 hypothetical protein [Nostoc punctiforme FACHB-252]
MGRLVLSGAVGAASRREVWGDGGDGGDKENKSCFSSQQSTVNSQQSTVNSQQSSVNGQHCQFPMPVKIIV